MHQVFTEAQVTVNDRRIQIHFGKALHCAWQSDWEGAWRLLADLPQITTMHAEENHPITEEIADFNANYRSFNDTPIEEFAWFGKRCTYL